MEENQEEYQRCGTNCGRYYPLSMLEGECSGVKRTVKLGDKCHLDYKKPKFDKKTQSFIDMIKRSSP